MSNAKKTGLSREQASALYEDLRKNFAAYTSTPGGQADPAVRAALQKLKIGKQTPKPSREMPNDMSAAQMQTMMMMKGGVARGPSAGSKLAVTLLLLAGATRLTLSGLEVSGVMGVEPAQASMNSQMAAVASNLQTFSPEEVALLKTLDSRRVELEERRKRLDKRDEEMNSRDREFAIKLAELRELTQGLRSNREQDDKKKTAQLDQLSNVYGSMDPKEAAQLIEQLDEPIALELLNRMPEKRIGQILSLMNKDKALVITKMLSGKLK